MDIEEEPKKLVSQKKQKVSEEMKKWERQTRYFPVSGSRVPRKAGSSKKVQKTPKIKKSIKPGSILIMLTTKHRGKRVIFLKQLTSGLLLVVGPYCINGVPLCRVEQSHVIATSSVVDISKIEVPERINDEYFKRDRIELKKLRREARKSILTEQPEKVKPATNHIEDAKFFDQALLPIINEVPLMKKYLKTPFALSKGQYPHTLVF